jgi:hypothetical protein
LTICVFIVALLVMAVFVFTGMNHLKNRSQQVSSGMPRAEVEDLLGEPYLSLPRSNGDGELLVWTDIYWQVDVLIDGNGRVLWCRCVPANSWYRITQSKLSSLFQ